MNAFLKDKHAIVTGGTRGIGYAIAKSLVDAGAGVAICGRSQEAVDAAVEELSGAQGGTVAGVAADVRREEDIERLFAFADEHFGSLDILINNAGVGVFKAVGEMSVEDWRKTIDTNLTGTFLCCRQALPRFMKSGSGFIINISSLAGKNPFAGGAAYNASKFGLNGFSEALMMDHRQDKVKVSYVMPGSVATEFVAGGGADWKIAAGDVADIVLHILGMPERTLISRVEVRPSRPPRKS